MLDKPNLISNEPKISAYCLAGENFNESFQVFPKSYRKSYDLYIALLSPTLQAWTVENKGDVREELQEPTLLPSSGRGHHALLRHQKRHWGPVCA